MNLWIKVVLRRRELNYTEKKQVIFDFMYDEVIDYRGNKISLDAICKRLKVRFC